MSRDLLAEPLNEYLSLDYQVVISGRRSCVIRQQEAG